MHTMNFLRIQLGYLNCQQIVFVKISTTLDSLIGVERCFKNWEKVENLLFPF